jgi:RND family efflux transporter MFP subunit
MHFLSIRSTGFLAVSLVLAGMAVGCGRTPPPTEEHTPPAPVKVARAKRQPTAEWTHVLGVTQPLPTRVARISAPVEGQLRDLLQVKDGKGNPVTEGMDVTRGQVIAQLDDRVLRANRAKLVAAQAELAEQQRQADLAVELARIDVKRLEALTRSGSTSPIVSNIELEKAKLSLQDAESKLKAARDRQAAGKEELKAIDEQLDLYTLRAPIAGRLGIVQVVPGQTLAIGTVVADVVDLGEIDVLGYVPPATAARLATDQLARLAPAGDAAATLEGKVVFISVQAQSDTGNFAVKVRFPNKDLKVRANSVARVQVQTRPEAERWLVPESALLEDQDPPGIVVVQDVKTEKHEDKEEKVGTAKNLRAVLGLRDRGRRLVEILALEDPETDPKKKVKVALADAVIVVEGGFGLKDGDELKVEEAEAAEPK